MLVPPVVVVETAEEGLELLVTTAVCAAALGGKSDRNKYEIHEEKAGHSQSEDREKEVKGAILE